MRRRSVVACLLLAGALLLQTWALSGTPRVKEERQEEPEWPPQIGMGLPPWTFGRGSETKHSGLEWYLSYSAHVSSTDSIWIESDLINRSGGTIHFDLTAGGAEVVLTPKGKQPRTCALRQERLEGLTLNHTPKADEWIWKTRFDLRACFGKLAPGEYALHVVVPAKSYRVGRLADFEHRDMKTDVLKFQVHAATLKKAQEALGDYRVMIQRRGTFPDGLPRGVLTNNLKRPIEFPLPPLPLDAQSPPLRPQVAWVRWLGDQTWIFSRRPEQPRKHWKKQRLEPGQSVEVVLPEWDLEGDGIYRFVMAVFDAEKPEWVAAYAASEAFAIDRVKPR